MATYPVVNKDTGEQKEVVMSINDWDQWLDDNPMWTRDWSDPTTLPGSGEVGFWQDKLYAKNPGWKDVMQGVKAAAPTNKSITEKY